MPEPRTRNTHVETLNAYRDIYDRSLNSPDAFWREQSEHLEWFHPPYGTVNADFEAVDFSWFAGGRLNASFNCVDRHAAKTPDRCALIWIKDEPGQYQRITYRELKHQVARFANVLLDHGVRKGDRVAIYMPMIPEAAYAMLACARIGAVHSVVFAGFSAEALRDRVVDAGCKVVLTANEGLRGSKRIPLKDTVDDAIQGITSVTCVLVARRTDREVPMQVGRDYWLHEEMTKHRPTCPSVWMASEDPLFILYTSGSTGRPKGVLHTTGGYLTYASYTHRTLFDLRSDDVYFCAADVGWITGHSYIVYGPLTNGATTCMFESVPTYPDAGRYWQIVEDLKVSIFYTAPTAIRAIARAGDEPVTRHDRSSLRVLGTVGEPINPEVWNWYDTVVGESRCDIVDTWWQTETGGCMISPIAGVTSTKPGSATLPLPGVDPVLLDDEGKELTGNGVEGNLCLRSPWPGQARTVYGDHARFEDTYFSRFPGYYFTGDGCRRDEDGYYWITGRVDDVLNVSGHRLGTAEIESALVAHEYAAEAAVVAIPHELKGQGIFAFVQVTSDVEELDPEEVIGALKQQVRQQIGKIAAPDQIQLVSGLPKTRSGKIMRRILRKVAVGQYDDLGDTSTLAEPAVVESLIEGHQASG